MLVVLMVRTGFATALLAGINKIVFQRSGDPMPPRFTVYPTFVAHLFIAAFLVGFVIVDVLTAFYHQFIKKDGLVRRMWFGRCVVNPSAPAK